MKRLIVVTLLFALLGIASTALGQSLPNPTGAEFTPSPDHAVISSYEIGWFLGAATSPVSTVDIGKPVPTAANLCIVGINVMPLAFGEYTAKVRAKIAGTPIVYSEWSEASNPFQRVPGRPGGPVIKK